MSDRAAWTPARFFVATDQGPIQVAGYTLDGLGLHHDGCLGGIGIARRTRWHLTHLGSGAKLVEMVGGVGTVFPVARKIAACSDWTLFDMPDGWKQTDPSLPAKLLAIFDAHPEVGPCREIEARQASAEDARAVIEATAALAEAEA